MGEAIILRVCDIFLSIWFTSCPVHGTAVHGREGCWKSNSVSFSNLYFHNFCCLVVLFSLPEDMAFLRNLTKLYVYKNVIEELPEVWCLLMQHDNNKVVYKSLSPFSQTLSFPFSLSTQERAVSFLFLDTGLNLFHWSRASKSFILCVIITRFLFS